MNEQKTQQDNKPAIPQQTLLQGREYTPAAATNVQATWRKFGWVPPSEQQGAKA